MVLCWAWIVEMVLTGIGRRNEMMDQNKPNNA